MDAFSQYQLKLQQQSEPFRKFAPIDAQIHAPVSFLNDGGRADPYPSFVRVMGLAPAGDGGGEWEPQRKRLKEQDFFVSSPVASFDFLQAGTVSTGLGLSIDDGRAAASSDDSLLLLIDSHLGRELERMDAEMDRFIRFQGERLRQSILETVEAKQLQTLASLEETTQRRIRDKEAELEDLKKKNMELEELSRQLSIDVGRWQQRANYSENMTAAFKFNLQQVSAQRRDNKEGCGDSEVDDTASCCNGNGNGGGIEFQILCKEKRDATGSMNCKVCGASQVCMLLLPCRHLCLCKDCESTLSYCPLCRSSKFLGIEVYM